MSTWKEKAAATLDAMPPERLARMMTLVSRTASPCDLCAVDTDKAPAVLLGRMRNGHHTGLCAGCIERSGMYSTAMLAQEKLPS